MLVTLVPLSFSDGCLGHANSEHWAQKWKSGHGQGRWETGRASCAGCTVSPKVSLPRTGQKHLFTKGKFQWYSFHPSPSSCWSLSRAKTGSAWKPHLHGVGWASYKHGPPYRVHFLQVLSDSCWILLVLTLFLVLSNWFLKLIPNWLPLFRDFSREAKTRWHFMGHLFL